MAQRGGTYMASAGPGIAAPPRPNPPPEPTAPSTATRTVIARGGTKGKDEEQEQEQWELVPRPKTEADETGSTDSWSPAHRLSSRFGVLLGWGRWDFTLFSYLAFHRSQAAIYISLLPYSCITAYGQPTVLPL
ncbi:hypothetical protein DL766_003720 [Monosporascus sp. MC13-8B]|uniref:Uncharacterized protein n=1 Tax=Monosporascus cannonballus TaxID=155416 RepID=A0ABY0H613_9PEZI|nr:hypothetical protein DL762_006106 [Monosporascus cannonballus]RYO88268.1 hypothetical protein DL763_006055 [Monosporascus cannonballus]RYP32996.1 hypothetical protein DL766_003720 [Monosporascus sp. MC13-8B]